MTGEAGDRWSWRQVKLETGQPAAGDTRSWRQSDLETGRAGGGDRRCWRQAGQETLGTEKQKSEHPCPCFQARQPASPAQTASLAKWLRRPPRERKVPGSNPACAGIFSWSSHASDLNIDTPVATLPGAWRYRVSAGTGRPGVSIL